MVSFSKILSGGLLFASQNQFRDVAAPELAAKDQYNVVRYLAAAGPYVQSRGYGISTDIPETCTVEQVQYYSRHGERYPGQAVGLSLEATLKKLQGYNSTITGPLSFLNDYQYFVDDFDLYERETTPINSEGPYTGYETLLKAGTAFRAKYNSLYDPEEPLPIFIAASERVYDSALFFAQGFLGLNYSDDKLNKVVVSENKSQGINSLTPRWGCTAFNSTSNAAAVAKFPSDYIKKIISRFIEGNSGLNVTSADVKNFFQICAYELTSRGYSPFCGLFTPDEYVTYSYANDLNFYYTSGPGGNLTREIGSVQVNASLQLLKDEEASNKIWLTFTHDTDIELFHAALGLFDPINPLPVDRVELKDTYHHVDVVPMGGRTITEKLKCDNETYVRYIVNDAVVPIPGCADGPGFSCEISKYEDYVHEKIGDIQLKEDCEVPDDVPQSLTFYWDYTEVAYNVTAPKVTA